MRYHFRRIPSLIRYASPCQCPPLNGVTPTSHGVSRDDPRCRCEPCCRGLPCAPVVDCLVHSDSCSIRPVAPSPSRSFAVRGFHGAVEAIISNPSLPIQWRCHEILPLWRVEECSRSTYRNQRSQVDQIRRADFITGFRSLATLDLLFLRKTV